jgi:hypothetical protein
MALLIPCNLFSQVLINEFLASNISTEFAPDYNYEDWIELYNAGSSSVDLEGYYLTDDPEYLQKFRISESLKIYSKSHKLIWADKK